MTKIQEIFEIAFPQVERARPLSPEQRKAAWAIMNCKTGALGFNSDICPNCGKTVTHFNSCRNRNCPNCQAVPKERWVDKRSSEIIDGSYYHLVFTVPAELNPLFYTNQALLYDLIHKCSAETILQLAADKKFLGAVPGIIQVLHTWGQRLNYHPHIHAIVTGAGLYLGCRYVPNQRKDFFVPVRVLSRKFRGKFMDQLKRLYDNGKLCIPKACSSLDDPFKWQFFCNKLYSQDWNCFIKQTFNGNGNAIEYLGRYTHKIAISNARIVSITDGMVSFHARDYKTGNQETISIPCTEFVRRFLMHVLPAGFQKIRYYGLFCNRFKAQNLALIFRIQGSRKFSEKFAGCSSVEVILMAFGKDLTACPNCGFSRLKARASPA